MDVQERLTLEAASANTLIACEHVHRYQVAASLCAGLRVVDLACGSGYGSVILGEAATSVLGVDNDAATIDMARATVGAESDVRFEAADAVAFLRSGLEGDHDAVVCLEGVEHFTDLAGAVDALSALADDGMKLVISVPNSRTFAEENEFHVTDFGYDEATTLADRLGATVLYQFNAEGSLIRGGQPGALEGERLLDQHGEPEYANHFILCSNLGDRIESEWPPARMQLAAAPGYNRHMLALERANRELWRENVRLGRKQLGTYDAAAAATALKLDRELRREQERNRAMEGELEHLRHRVRLLDAPRHVAVERARDRLMRSKLFYGVVRRLWALVRFR